MSISECRGMRGKDELPGRARDQKRTQEKMSRLLRHVSNRFRARNKEMVLTSPYLARHL